MIPDVDCGLCHASAIHISPALLFVSRKSWNPTSTRSIPTTKNVSRFVPFRKRVFTILPVNACFSLSLVILCILHHLFRCDTSFTALIFCALLATCRLKPLKPFGVRTGLKSRICFDVVIEGNFQ